MSIANLQNPTATQVINNAEKANVNQGVTNQAANAVFETVNEDDMMGLQLEKDAPESGGPAEGACDLLLGFTGFLLEGTFEGAKYLAGKAYEGIKKLFSW